MSPNIFKNIYNNNYLYIQGPSLAYLVGGGGGGEFTLSMVLQFYWKNKLIKCGWFLVNAVAEDNCVISKPAHAPVGTWVVSA